MILGPLALLAVVGMMLLRIIPDYLAYFIVGMSVLSFILYAMDKNAAEKRRWRTPESTFHMLSLLGGWPGAMIAQQGFRHKNRKRSFQIVFWLTVAGNLALVWFLIAVDELKGLP